MTVTVECERDEDLGLWVAQVVEMPELITQAKHLKDVPWMICDAAGLFDITLEEDNIELKIKGHEFFPPTNISEVDPYDINVGTILKSKWLEPLKISQKNLALKTGLSQTHVSQIVNGKRRITADVSIRLGYFFKVDSGYFLRMQNTLDLHHAQKRFNFKKS